MGLIARAVGGDAVSMFACLSVALAVALDLVSLALNVVRGVRRTGPSGIPGLSCLVYVAVYQVLPILGGIVLGPSWLFGALVFHSVCHAGPPIVLRRLRSDHGQ